MADTLIDVQDAVFGRIASAFAAAGAPVSSIVIVWPDKRDTGDDAPRPPADGGAYAEVDLHLGSGEPTGMGDTERMYTHSGTVVVDLNTPHGDGMRLALLAGQVFLRATRGPSVDGVIWRSNESRDMGKYGNYRRTRMTAAFDFDQLG